MSSETENELNINEHQEPMMVFFKDKIGEETKIEVTNQLEKRACFEIVCSIPDLFSISPNTGFLDAGETEIVNFTILKNEESPEHDEANFFEFQYISCGDEEQDPSNIWLPDIQPEQVNRLHFAVKDSDYETEETWKEEDGNFDDSSEGNNRDKGSTSGKRVVEDAINGAAYSAVKNAARYIVKLGGRKSNIVSIFDKASISAKGNPRWFARVDMPHGKVGYHHINVNKAITGVKDPHIQISAGAAKAAGALGEVATVINKVAPVLMVASVAFEVVKIGCNIHKDVKNRSSRNTIQHVATSAASIGGSVAGASMGAAIGTAIFPGVGTFFGSLIGGIASAIGAGQAAHHGSKAFLNEISYDIYDVKCTKCGKMFQCRRYKTGHKELCEECEKEG